jgi:hypothetical protein
MELNSNKKFILEFKKEELYHQQIRAFESYPPFSYTNIRITIAPLPNPHPYFPCNKTPNISVWKYTQRERERVIDVNEERRESWI